MYENYKILKTEREVDKLIKNCKKTGYCSFDFETSGHEYHSPLGYPTIMGISFQPGSAFIIPLGHFDSVFKNEYQYIFKKISKELLENPKIVKVAWNAKFEYQWVKRLGGEIHGRFFDGMLAKYLLNEERPNDLKSMVMRYIPEYGGYESYEGSNLPWDQKPLKGLSQYCAMDCDLTLRLMIFFENQLIKNDFYKLFRNLLMMGTRVLAESEYMGFDIDTDKLAELDAKYLKLIEESDKTLRNHRKIKKFEKYLIEQRVNKLISKIEMEISDIEEELLDITDPVVIRRKEKSIQTRYDKIDRLNAHEFTTASERKVLEPVNFSSPQQMGELFFTSKKGFRFDIIKYTTDKAKNETENPSTDESVLLELSKLDKSGFCKELLNYRGLSKLYGAFIKGIQERLGQDGKIHARYNLHQTVTGRLSSNDPNMQQIPRTTTNADIKTMFIPPKGYLLLQLDYSQAELRVMAAAAGETTMIKWFKEGKDIHIMSALKKYHLENDYDRVKKILDDEDDNDPEFKIWKVRRKQAKCYTGDTEILTEKGWQRLDSYDGISKVAQYDFQSEEISFTDHEGYGTVNSKINYKYIDRNIDMDVTDEHKTLFITRAGKKIKADFRDLVGKSGYMPSAGYIINDSQEDEYFIRFLSMYIADGNIQNKGNKIRFGFSKERKITRCKEILKKLNIIYNERIDKMGNTKIYLPKKHNRWLYEKVILYSGFDKTLKWENIIKLDGKIYLQEAKNWDSYVDNNFQNERVTFSTRNEINADIMQAWGSINGIRVVKYTKEKTFILSYRPEGNTLSKVNLSNAEKYEVPEGKTMWSVTVPKRNLVTRKNGKVVLSGNTINFGIIYGQGANKLAESLECSVEEAKQFLKEFDKTFPKVASFVKKQHKLAQENAYVKSVFGRKRRLPNVDSDEKWKVAEALRFAVNAPIQGAASDYALFSSILIWERSFYKRGIKTKKITKDMYNIYLKEGLIPIDLPQVYTVHDSLGFFVRPEHIHEVVPILKAICANPETKEWFGFQIDDVTMKVDFEVSHENWGELKTYRPEIDYTQYF